MGTLRRPLQQIDDEFRYDSLADDAHMGVAQKLDDYNAYKARTLLFAHSTRPNGGEKAAWTAAFYRHWYTLVLN